MSGMKRKERIDTALRFEQPDRPPHFEQLFELSEEAFGAPLPGTAEFEGAPPSERGRLFERAASAYAKIVEEFEWDAVLVYPPAAPAPYADPNHVAYEFISYLKEYLRSHFGEPVPVGGFLWDSLICIDKIKDYVDFSVKLYEDRQRLVDWAESICAEGLLHAGRLISAGADFVDVASDHAFNSGSFLSPADFAQLVAPYMARLTRYIQSRGAWVIMHTDGNIYGLMDQILEIRPDVLQSIDPMAGMDIKEVKRLTYGKVALMGNVQCSYLQDGPVEKVVESGRYCLEHAAPGGGYIFSSSNTIFKGVPLQNYRAMLSCLREAYKGTY